MTKCMHLIALLMSLMLFSTTGCSSHIPTFEISPLQFGGEVMGPTVKISENVKVDFDVTVPFGADVKVYPIIRRGMSDAVVKKYQDIFGCYGEFQDRAVPVYRDDKKEISFGPGEAIEYIDDFFRITEKKPFTWSDEETRQKAEKFLKENNLLGSFSFQEFMSHKIDGTVIMRVAVFGRTIDGHSVKGSTIRVTYAEDGLYSVELFYSDYGEAQTARSISKKEFIRRLREEAEFGGEISFDDPVEYIKISDVQLVYFDPYTKSDATHIQPCYVMKGVMYAGKASKEFTAGFSAVDY